VACDQNQNWWPRMLCLCGNRPSHRIIFCPAGPPICGNVCTLTTEKNMGKRELTIRPATFRTKQAETKPHYTFRSSVSETPNPESNPRTHNVGSLTFVVHGLSFTWTACVIVSGSGASTRASSSSPTLAAPIAAAIYPPPACLPFCSRAAFRSSSCSTFLHHRCYYYCDLESGPRRCFGTKAVQMQNKVASSKENKHKQEACTPCTPHGLARLCSVYWVQAHPSVCPQKHRCRSR